MEKDKGGGGGLDNYDRFGHISATIYADDRPKTWCVKCTPMCASARVAPSNTVYQWFGYRSTGTGVLTTKIFAS